ncbi:MAG: single-stranded DNA-binding protein [Candidatus Komeilibacteria bacterium CG_4_10_14_0_2_um_filter_37_10]|uniref:Single-stranded DNA-binding protein n=1 Tax=Candidatus Komeilibacteria bacterium CG_4_10_14_0_2_um_filter_37_10 TaxID=1974470 RepID=A0A2M7VEY5_9BACT|nr:MAG: single-stranded DNA-binding protein [Candidatus Komeilibacteria bacterium CG_4_10_14_0_2_um_filter_37_10]PJA92736.1 MAG: single-stranded DNA-binding protein [Candidatus Komeilibacteria bacterium CG_4_9_14_3_um_filter_37_5]
MDLNKVMIIGRLTRDPEIRTTTSGEQNANLSIATNFSWSDKSGQRQERSEFHNVIAWRKLAEICQKYLHKGSRLYVEGRLQTRSWEDQSGVKKYRTEVVLENLIMLDSKGSGAGSATTEEEPAAPADNNLDEEINVEDIPF